MIPYDATQHIQGMAQGVQNAMPGIQAGIASKQPGSPTVEAYLREWEERVVKGGENAKVVGDDLATRFENDIKNGVQHADVNVPSPGFNNGTPALGGPNVPMNPIAQAPNSFAAPAGGGISGNAAPAGGLSPINNRPVNVPHSTVNGSNAELSRPASDTAEGAINEYLPKQTVNFSEQGSVPAMQTGKIDMLKRPQEMQTVNNPNQPTYSIRSRGEQEQALADKARMDKMDNGENSLEFKRDKLNAEMKIKTLKAMADRLTDQEKMDLQRTLGEEGMSLKAKIAVMDAWIRMKNAEDLNKVRQESNRIKAQNAGNKLSPKLQHLWNVFKNAKDKLAQYQTSRTQRKNPDEIKRLLQERQNALTEYSMARVDEGLDLYQDEGYISPVPPRGVDDPGE